MNCFYNKLEVYGEVLSGLTAAIKAAHNQQKSLETEGKQNKTKPEGHDAELNSSCFNNSTGKEPQSSKSLETVMICGVSQHCAVL